MISNAILYIDEMENAISELQLLQIKPSINNQLFPTTYTFLGVTSIFLILRGFKLL